jgi:hypothetical protein
MGIVAVALFDMVSKFATSHATRIRSQGLFAPKNTWIGCQDENETYIGTVQQIREVAAKIQLGFGINPNKRIGSHCNRLAITITE